MDSSRNHENGRPEAPLADAEKMLCALVEHHPAWPSGWVDVAPRLIETSPLPPSAIRPWS